MFTALQRLDIPERWNPQGLIIHQETNGGTSERPKRGEEGRVAPYEKGEGVFFLREQTLSTEACERREGKETGDCVLFWFKMWPPPHSGGESVTWGRLSAAPYLWRKAGSFSKWPRWNRRGNQGDAFFWLGTCVMSRVLRDAHWECALKDARLKPTSLATAPDTWWGERREKSAYFVLRSDFLQKWK